MLTFVTRSTYAQYQLNFGLHSKQPKHELPKSKAPYIHPIRKAFKKVNAELTLDRDGNHVLNKGWEMIEGYKLFKNGISLWNIDFNEAEWYNATVPGTVLTTLVDQGVYSDPYYSLNNLHIPDTLCRMDWWYRISFDAPSDVNDSDYELLLNGINYKADVWLNGKRLGNMKGAFRRGIFPIKGIIKYDEKNVLAIHIFPPNNPGIPHEQNKLSFGDNGGSLCLDGPTFISSEGWDWIPGIRDRNIGIWQDVKLVRVGDVKMQNPFITTDLPLPDTSYADITIKSEVVNMSYSPQKFTITGKIDGATFSRQIALSPKEIREISFNVKEFNQLRIRNPQLWWPNGYGKQNLYNLNLKLEQNNKTIQEKNIKFGIREFSYELMAQNVKKENIRLNYSPTDSQTDVLPIFNYKEIANIETSAYPNIEIPTLEENAEKYITRLDKDLDNPFLIILVNGKRIFCRGGNWGMDDGMKRVSRKRLEPYIKLHKEAGFNMIRNWTGETTEELFYTLCDEYGILVWNDFMMSTQTFNLEPLDHKLFLDNVEDIIRRFRNHPSIAVWCPRNEGYAPPKLEDGFQKIIMKEDGTRHYHGSSMDLNLCSSGPWHYLVKSMDYLTKNADGFTTELGAPSVPTANTIKKFIAKEDLWPIGDVWYYHDMHIESFDWKDYIRDVNRIGKSVSQNIEEFAARAQFMNYNLYRNMLETWNSKMWNYASGILLWMSHPAWPSMTWQTYSYDYETPGSYFGSKKACEDIHIQWNSITNHVEVSNVTLKQLSKANIKFSVFDINGDNIINKQIILDINSNSLTKCFEATIPVEHQDLCLVRVELGNSKGQRISLNDYWINPLDNNDYSSISDIGKSKISITEKNKRYKDKWIYFDTEIRNTSNNTAISIKLNVRDKNTDKIVLPAYISDGYFNLLPGEARVIKVEIPNDNNGNTYISAEGLNINQNKI